MIRLKDGLAGSVWQTFEFRCCDSASSISKPVKNGLIPGLHLNSLRLFSCNGYNSFTRKLK